MFNVAITYISQPSSNYPYDLKKNNARCLQPMKQIWYEIENIIRF